MQTRLLLLVGIALACLFPQAALAASQRSPLPALPSALKKVKKPVSKPAPKAVAPTAGPSAADWLRWGGDDQLTNYRPAQSWPELTAATATNLVQRWETKLDGKMVGSPIYVDRLALTKGQRPSHVLFAATGAGSIYAIDAGNGAVIWQKSFPTLARCDGEKKGFYGTPVIDRASELLYAVSADGKLHALKLTSGEEAFGWPLPLLAAEGEELKDFIWSGLTLVKGTLYIPTASACEIDGADEINGDGRIFTVDTKARTVGTIYDVVPGPGNMGSIWGYGGLSVDPLNGNLWTATGNSNGSACACDWEAEGGAEAVLTLSPDLKLLQADRPPNIPDGNGDTDYGSTPMLFQPEGCPPLAAVYSKNGVLYVYNRATLGPPIWATRAGASDLNTPFIGQPSWSKDTQTLVVANAVIYHTEEGEFSRTEGVAGYKVGPGCSLPSEPTWLTEQGQSIKPPALVIGTIAFVPGGGRGWIDAVDTATGAFLWHGTNMSSPVWASPIQAGKKIVVSDFAGLIRSFGFAACPVGPSRALPTSC